MHFKHNFLCTNVRARFGMHFWHRCVARTFRMGYPPCIGDRLFPSVWAVVELPRQAPARAKEIPGQTWTGKVENLQPPTNNYVCPPLPSVSPGTCRGHPHQRGVDVYRGPHRKPLPAGLGHGRVRKQANCGVWFNARGRGHRATQPPTHMTRRGTACPGAPQCMFHTTN